MRDACWFERLALNRKNRRVGLDEVLALHPFRARPRADQQRVVSVFERDVRVVARNHLVHQRKRAVVEFHDHAVECPERGRDFEKLQYHRLIGAEHFAGRDAKDQCVADLTGGAGDGDPNGWFHEAIPSFKKLRPRAASDCSSVVARGYRDEITTRIRRTSRRCAPSRSRVRCKARHWAATRQPRTTARRRNDQARRRAGRQRRCRTAG